jgi:hypothetical protein
MSAARLFGTLMFLECARYWCFTPRLCWPYRAQTKGKVESGVKYMRRNFLCGLPGREPASHDYLAAQMRWWITEVANQRVHGTTHFFGGFIGVDFFFVISAFLLSSAIFREMKRSRFLMFLFYQRRIRRTFPALLVMSIVTTIVRLNSPKLRSEST